MSAPLHVDVRGEGPRALFVHGSMGWGLDTFPDQRSLAEHGYRIELVDRRGFGRSPDTARADVEADALDLLALMTDPVHLVGQSAGGVAALLAAAARPDLVRSLVLVEPAVLGLVDDDPAVTTYVANLAALLRRARGLTEEQFYAGFIEAGGSTVSEEPALSDDDRRVIRTTMTERPWWEVPVPVQALSSATCPRVVCIGGRADAPPEVAALSGGDSG